MISVGSQFSLLVDNVEILLTSTNGFQLYNDSIVHSTTNVQERLEILFNEIVLLFRRYVSDSSVVSV
jgi:hypothetical protein